MQGERAFELIVGLKFSVALHNDFVEQQSACVARQTFLLLQTLFYPTEVLILLYKDYFTALLRSVSPFRNKTKMFKSPWMKTFRMMSGMSFAPVLVDRACFGKTSESGLLIASFKIDPFALNECKN